MPQVATINGDNDLIDVFPAVAVLFLDGVKNADICGLWEHFQIASDLLDTPEHIFTSEHPFCLISTTQGYGEGNGLHLPISFVSDTLEIALDIEVCVLSIESEED